LVASVLAHELEDVKEPGASAKIRGSDGALAGDVGLPTPAVGECITVDHGGAATRICTALLEDGSQVVLGVSAQDERERRALTAWALLAGALVGAAIGGIASYRSARWTIAPLTELGDRVRRIDADAPRSELLDPTARHAEIEDMRAAIVELVDRLRVSLTHAQTFAAQAAHELRTPLAVLAGELELMIESARAASDDPSKVAALARLHGVVLGLTRLAQRLLVLAAPGRTHDGGARRGEPVDLADVVEVVRAALAPAARQRLIFEIDDDTLVRGDPELLRSLLQNAIDNAVKFSTGTVSLRITGTDCARIDVVDKGPGVPAEDRERVFAAFYRRADALSRATPGHGLGLALIAHVAAVHGGRATFLDTPGGAHLRIELPRWSG
jgi:signal transduction histidine kinase